MSRLPTVTILLRVPPRLNTAIRYVIGEENVSFSVEAKSVVKVFGGVEFEFCYAPNEVPAEIVNTFRLFYLRYNQLRENMADLRGSETRFSMDFTKDQGRVTAKGKSKFNSHRLKGLYLDYRPFAAQREITHFSTVCNKVIKHFPDPDVRKLVDIEQGNWREDDFSELHGRTFDGITKTLFNAALFHTDIKHQADLIELTSEYDDLALQSVLFLGIDRRLAAIRNISFMVGACSADCQAVRIPLYN